MGINDTCSVTDVSFETDSALANERLCCGLENLY